MSDTEKLDALLAAYNQAETLLSSILNHFERRALLPSNVTRQDVQEAVALLFERLDKQDRILAALREPSEGVVKAAWEHIISRGVTRMHDMNDTIRTAVAAAETETMTPVCWCQIEDDLDKLPT